MSGLSFDLDRSSPVPLWFQVAGQLEAAIERGVLAPGDRLENETGLADRWGLSRPTMRRAIQELVDKGLLVRKRGIGTQVVNGQVKRQLGLTSLFDDLARSGQNPSTRVLTHDVVGADDHVARQLNLAPGEAVVHLERLRLAGDEPLALMRNWLPPDLAGEFTTQALEARGLYELIRATGAHMRIASQGVSAREADLGESRLLGVRRGAPLLTMERTTYDDSGRAIELGSHVYRAGIYSFEMTVVER